MNFRELIEELDRVHRGALLLPNAQAIDYSRDVVSNGRGGHGKHGTTTTTPTYGADLPLAVELERALERVLTVYTRRLDAERHGLRGSIPPQDKVSAARKAETDAILRQLGDPTEVAYMNGRTTEAVRKLRQRHGLDPDTGERAQRDVLTAPARDALSTLKED